MLPDSSAEAANCAEAEAMKLLCSFVALGIFGLHAETVTVRWGPSPIVPVTSYHIYYGQSPRPSDDPYVFAYPNRVTIPSTESLVTLTNITPGIWYFAATGVTSYGLESFYSEEVAYTNRSFAPVNLRITGPSSPLSLVIESSFDGLVWTPIHTNDTTQRVELFRAAIVQ